MIVRKYEIGRGGRLFDPEPSLSPPRDGFIESVKREREPNGLAIDDSELLARAGQGDKNSFALLCARHLRGCAAVAQRMLGNAAEADEVAQEAFLRLWRYAPRWEIDGAASVRTWLYRVATNLCVDILRRRHGAPLEEAASVEDPSAGPFETVNGEDRRRLVQELLSELPERQRIAVILSYFEDMSGQEIARTMELSAGAVESLLVRGREGLRKGLKKRGLTWGEAL